MISASRPSTFDVNFALCIWFTHLYFPEIAVEPTTRVVVLCFHLHIDYLKYFISVVMSMYLRGTGGTAIIFRRWSIRAYLVLLRPVFVESHTLYVPSMMF